MNNIILHICVPPGPAGFRALADNLLSLYLFVKWSFKLLSFVSRISKQAVIIIRSCQSNSRPTMHSPSYKLTYSVEYRTIFQPHLSSFPAGTLGLLAFVSLSNWEIDPRFSIYGTVIT